MIFLVNELEGEPAVKLAEDRDEGDVNKRWDVGPIEGMVIFTSCKLKVKRLKHDLRSNNGKNAKTANGQANGQLRSVNLHVEFIDWII